MTIFYAPNQPSSPATSPYMPRPTPPLRTSSIRYRLPSLSIAEDSNARVLRLRRELAETLRLFGAALASDMNLRGLSSGTSVVPWINEPNTAVHLPNYSALSLVSTQSDTTSRKSFLALERQNVHVVDDVPVDATALPDPLFCRPCRYSWCGVCQFMHLEDARPSLQLRRVVAREGSAAAGEAYVAGLRPLLEKSTGVTYSFKKCRTRRCFHRIRNAAKRLVQR